MQTKFLEKAIYIYMIIMALVGCYIYGIILKANGDNVEHLHTSWLIWMGYIPYKDFFQHHNPLTWYVSAPLVAALINDFNIFSIFNIIGIGILCLIALVQYKIFLLNGGSRIAALFLAAILISSYSLLWSTDYRPDTFMFLFFYIGLYYLFTYTEKKEEKKLFISFLSFFISFMFTQKVLMHLVIPGIAVIYWLFSGRIKTGHFFKSLIVPLLLGGIFIGYLYHHDALKTYWLSNYPFNTYIPKIFEEQRIIFPPKEYVEFYIFLPLACLAAVFFLFKGTAIEKTFSLMFWLETVLRMLYFSAFLHYVIFWLMLAIMLTVMFLDKFTKWHKVFAAIGLIYLLFMLFYNYYKTYREEIISHNIMNGHELAFNVLTPCDYALNGYYATYNLKAKDAGYYAILLGQIDVLGEKSGVAKKDDLNQLIRTKMPKIISSGIYWDTYWEQRGKKIPVHIIDSYLLNTYYEPTGVGDIFILKQQYQKHTCVYNGKEWKYMD